MTAVQRPVRSRRARPEGAVALALLLCLLTARAGFAGTGTRNATAAELDALVRQVAGAPKNPIESCDASRTPSGPMHGISHGAWPHPRHAIKGDSCNSLHYITQGAAEDLFLTSVEQGACFGASGAVCGEVFAGDLVKLSACSLTPHFNLEADQGLLLCAKGAVPPRMVFPNTGTVGGSIPTALRLNDFSVSLVVDRSGNLAADAPLAELPGCFSGNLASDCNVFSACLDLNMNFGMNNLVCGDGTPGFKAVFDSIQIVTRDIGVVCSGDTSPTTDGDVLSASSDNTITVPLGQNAGAVSPDICGAGLNLAGLVECAAPEIVSIEADGIAEFKDYLGITCKIQ